ncbi:hypothetical protein QWY79_12675 [Halomonas sabkhae]|uniref:tetratricopeptide repeat protein n=1 Tax=Halomonas sabkhae TaxID=626223 RepID=UPI0025B312E6|nr:hypothetical protein [Halomonas sabkhae]MDN3526119.1 hypothetical protein [Halomonas sabkhae]
MRHAVNLTLVLGLLAGLSAPAAVAAPTLPGGIISDLEALESSLADGELAAVERQARRQAERLAGGNAADRWARALYLQLAANAEARQGDEGAAADLLATARAIRGVEPDQADRWLRQEAGLRARLGEHERAADLLADWLQRHAADAEAQWLMAQLEAEGEDWNNAADWAQRALDNSREPSRQQLALAATALQKADRQAAALKVIERQLAGAQQDPDAWRRAAGLAQRMGDPGRAAALWETAWRKGVLSGADDLLQRIKLHLAAGTPARAAEILEEALSGGTLPDSLEHRRMLARAWHAARDRQQALAAWRRVAERSGAAQDWLRLGQIATQWGHLEVARDALGRARQGGASEAAEWLASLPEKHDAGRPSRAGSTDEASPDT